MLAAVKMDASEIKAAYSEALSLLGSGKNTEALLLLGRILEANPNIPEPLWHVARIWAENDKFDRAISFAARAALLKPSEPVVWTTWADIVALSGDTHAEQMFLAELRASKLPPEIRIRLQDRFGSQRRDTQPDMTGLSKPTLSLIRRLLDDGALTKANDLLNSLLSKSPRHALLHNLKASIQSRIGKHTAALHYLRLAQKLDPYYAEAWVNEAQELERHNKLEDAVRSYRKAIERAPSNEKALMGYVTLCNQSGYAERCRSFGERLVSCYPESIHAHIVFGNTLTLLRDYASAEIVLGKAVELSNERSAEALMLLAQAVSNLGRDDAALSLIDKSIALKPNYVMALNRKALILQTLGRFEDAAPLFRKALSLAPMDGELWRSYVTGFKVELDDPVIAQMEDRVVDPALDDRSRAGFFFALGKVLEDVRQNDKAFSYFRRANDLVRALYPFDINQRKQEVHRVQEAFRGFAWSEMDVSTSCKNPVIFVTGMPRSGTTLVEQIIASHSRVTGAGELALLQTACQKLIMGTVDGPNHAWRLQDFPISELSSVGRNFLQEISVRFPHADIISDKSISTYMYVGLVKLILPEARIIVVRRDPRDTLLSIYKNRFPEGTHRYAYDLRDLAEYYATFVDMAKFWRQETPDWFTEIQYEKLVESPEDQSRRLISACGLEWEDDCLNFHQNKRKIDTLSVYQARQPISGGSVKAWQRYEKELSPMIDILVERGLLSDETGQ